MISYLNIFHVICKIDKSYILFNKKWMLKVRKKLSFLANSNHKMIYQKSNVILPSKNPNIITAKQFIIMWILTKIFYASSLKFSDLKKRMHQKGNKTEYINDICFLYTVYLRKLALAIISTTPVNKHHPYFLLWTKMQKFCG